VGTLLATGVLTERERLLLADFQNHTRDTLLSTVATEAFRIDFAQSPVVTVVPPQQVAEALQRMRRPATAGLDPALAREVAVRQGIKGIITGEIASAGSRYLLSAQLVTAASGEVLAARRVTAADSNEIVEAIDRLSKGLRERIGESFKSLRGDRPLEQVTTSSLEALRKYTQAIRLGDYAGDHTKAVPLLEEAVALDTGFATAYRTLGLYLGFLGERARQVDALTKAFRHQGRLTDWERETTRGLYYSQVTYELGRAAAAYRAVLERNRNDTIALNNLAAVLGDLGQHARAEELSHRLLALDSTKVIVYLNLANAQVQVGKRHEAERTFKRAAERFPDSPAVEWFGVLLAGAGGDYRAAEAHARRLKERHGENPFLERFASLGLGCVAAVHGRLAETEQQWRKMLSANAKDGAAGRYLDDAASLGLLIMRGRREPERGLREVERALSRYPLDSIKPLDRPYLNLGVAYAVAGQSRRARALLTEYERVVDPSLRRDAERLRHQAWGYVAMAEGRFKDAAAEFRAFVNSPQHCTICGLAELATAYDRLGERDSAVAMYERYVTTPHIGRLLDDAIELPNAYLRLGELYEAQAERRKAREYDARLIALWKDSDPELQPQVAKVRAALKRLGAESGN
jgi:eukaryotic-like serine/threonine-protein kinase